MHAAFTPFFSFIAFVFLLLACISVPTVKSLYLFYLTAAASPPLPPLRINFGVWGYCIPSARYGIAGVYRVTPAYCSPTRLGWTFDGKVASYLGTATKLESTISKATTIAFVFHPIATAFALLTFIVSIFLLRTWPDKPQRIVSILTFVCGILTTVFTTIAFLIDVIVVGILRVKIRDVTDGLVSLSYGNAVWLTVVATAVLWFAILGACFGVLQRRKKR